MLAGVSEVDGVIFWLWLLFGLVQRVVLLHEFEAVVLTLVKAVAAPVLVKLLVLGFKHWVLEDGVLVLQGCVALNLRGSKHAEGNVQLEDSHHGHSQPQRKGDGVVLIRNVEDPKALENRGRYEGPDDVYYEDDGAEVPAEESIQLNAADVRLLVFPGHFVD